MAGARLFSISKALVVFALVVVSPAIPLASAAMGDGDGLDADERECRRQSSVCIEDREDGRGRDHKHDREAEREGTRDVKRGDGRDDDHEGERGDGREYGRDEVGRAARHSTQDDEDGGPGPASVAPRGEEKGPHHGEDQDRAADKDEEARDFGATASWALAGPRGATPDAGNIALLRNVGAPGNDGRTPPSDQEDLRGGPRLAAIGFDPGRERPVAPGPSTLEPPPKIPLIPIGPDGLPLDLHKILPTKKPSSDFVLGDLGEHVAGPSSGYTATAANALPGPLREALSQLFLLAVGAAASLIAFILGFRHVNAANVLASLARQRILAALRERPGIGVREIAGETGMSPATAHHHLRQLERVGVVRRQRVGGKSLSYPVDEGAAARMRSLVGAFSRDTCSRDILALLGTEGGQSRSEIARALRIAHGSVGWRIGRMLDAGLVEETDGRRLRLCDKALERDSPSPLVPGSAKPQN